MPSLEKIVTYILGSSPSPENSTSSQQDQKVNENSNENDKFSKLAANGHTEEAEVDNNAHRAQIPSHQHSDPNHLTAKTDDTKRQLRSERSRLRSGINGANYTSEGDEDNLMWFENLDSSEIVDYDEKLQITDEPLPTTQEPITEQRASPFSFSLIVRPISTESKASLYDTPLNIRSRSDPLSDSVFAALHKRREREERHYQNFERDKVMYEKLQVERQLERLKGHNWVRAVVSMTTINDPKCETELSTKREKLIQELVNVLAKFESWKEREKKVRSLNGNEDDLASSMRMRLEERKKELQIVTGIIPKGRGGRGWKKVRKNKGNQTSTTITDSEAQAPTSVQRKRRKLGSEEPNPRRLDGNLNANTKQSKISAFGHPLPRIPYHQFDIPLEWIKNREKLRQADK
ncbi:something about silencing, SAS, complex subunit 4-domain-containing protein [Lipomyces tetrasporus]|uniref:Something about silencing, SAS, complex subunit 4-domain-containing protein n=1 Tax=Lipomyces tetrasporus TaxID=54092 RepID=A0AAD7QLH5_9ASCO|nr:something about silencing, SAS, complex subunit 4-domain-containing protein [Lipomyces tetrasporus]KAJ8097278.1 something about silencing, SAS, complex subunit 4-domain-containing protein [Lipomyces tetrasporus]